ncbi:unnamed protein product [Aureobasidium uvarum]|uniref:Pyrrolo-quinoline quinone repeat domain-containing protein n=1 Tax=Aureobasidium uvarum TaxID=2773716 RepID=A0A9N8PQV6_9PEZI|nr:unnamed protein product [Aureobasidium uvarum]
MALWATSKLAIGSSNAGMLRESCLVKFPVGVSAPLAILGDIAYFPTWDGRFVAFDYKSCQVHWNISVSDIITGFAPLTTLQVSYTRAASRSTPQFDESVLYFTTLAYALVVAVDRQTGAYLAVTQINSHELATLTMSPTFYKGKLLVGASSQEEAAAGFTPDYACCSFVGNMAAVEYDESAREFKTVWDISMITAGSTPPGWSGVAVRGSQPSIDEARSQVFVATGNVYSVPPEYESCLMKADTNITSTNSTCLPGNILQEAVLALDIGTGAIIWSHVVSPLDSWTTACEYGASLPNVAVCPGTPGPDADFGMAPTFVLPSRWTPNKEDTVVIGQKNGVIHAFSAKDVTLHWSSATSHDGVEGGLIWGIAVDDKRVYFAAVNSNFVSWQVQPLNHTIDNSAFGALSLLNGSILWEIPSPYDSISFVQPSVVNDTLFTGRTGQNKTGSHDLTRGGLIVIDKRSGLMIKDYNLDVNFHGGVAIQNDYVMFGTGYNGFSGVGGFHVYTL